MQKAILVLAGVLLGAGGAWLLPGLLSGSDADPAAVARGEALYPVCAVCHGDQGEGNPDTQAPSIGGQYAWYLERQLHNFRSGLRGVDPSDVNGQVMRPMALGLADDQAVADVAAFVSTLR